MRKFELDPFKEVGLRVIGSDIGPCEGECKGKDKLLFILLNGLHLCGSCYWKAISIAKNLDRRPPLIESLLSPMNIPFRA